MSTAATRPNILYILVDQLRRDALGHHGGPMPTPHLDRLADEGVSFSRAYCAYPMCFPARAALLSGQCCHALRDAEGEPYMYNNRRLALDTPTYAKALRDAGYRCGYVGKWHNDAGGQKFIPPGPRRQGFDDYFAGTEGGSPRTQPFIFTDEGEKIEYGEMWEPDLQTQLACDYLTTASKREEPFCLVVSYVPPHEPLDLPSTRADLLDRAKQTLDPQLRPNVPDRLAEQAHRQHLEYYANVLGIDDCVGDLLNSLDQNNLADDTLVMFVADHGDHLLSHGLRGKNQGYEEAVAVPTIFRWPSKIKPTGLHNTFVNHIDLAPTLLDFAGVEPPDSMQGRSLAPLLRGETDAGPNDSAYIEIDHPWYDYRFGQGPGGHKRCVVTDRWKLVLLESHQGYGRVIPVQLYDRQEDPYELNNLAEDPGHRPVINELMQGYAWPWMARTNDPFFELTLAGLDESAIEKIKERYRS